MAVEIKRHHSKRLYRHATPVFLTSVAVVALSALVLTHYNGLKQADQSQLGRAGLQSIIHVTHTKNGLAKLDTEVLEQKPVVKSKFDTNISSAGKNVNQSVSLQVNFDR